MPVMFHRCLKTCFFLFVLFAVNSNTGYAQRSLDRAVIEPFEDYSKCKAGFLSVKRDTLFPAKFENLKKIHAVSLRGVEMVDYETGWAYIISENNQFGCLSDLGVWIIPCMYEKLEFNSVFGAFIARNQGKYGVVGLNNAILVPFEFDKILTNWEIPDNMLDLVPVQKDNKVGLYSLSQRKVVSPIYESISFMRYSNDQSRLTKAEHFIISSDKKAGVSSRGVEELIAPKYKTIEYLEAARSKINPVYFLVTDLQNQQAVFDAKGKQLTAFIKGKVSPVYDRTNSWEKPLQFVEVEDSLRKEYMINLSTGKKTEPYLQKCLFPNCLYVQLEAEWKILDLNFNELYTSTNSQSFLWIHESGFPMWDEVNKEHHFYNDAPEDWNPEKEPLPMFVLMKTDSLSTEEQAECLGAPENAYSKKDYAYGCGLVSHYALFNLKTKKISPFSYMEIRKFQYKAETYYWAFHDFEGTERESRKVDIYNSKGRMIRQINAFYSVDYIGGNSNPVLCTKSEEQYMLYDIAGNQLSSVAFDSYPNVMVYVDRNFGVVAQENSEEAYYQFTDLNKRPLLSNRKYSSYHFLEDSEYNIQAIVLEEMDGLSTVLSNKFEVLLDSCSLFPLWDHDLKELSEEAYLLVKGLKAYVLEYGKMNVLDKTYFWDEEETVHIRSSSRYLEIDRFGNIIPEPPAPEQLEVKHYGSIFLTETKEGLKVENKDREFVQLIENVEKVETHKGLVQITLKNHEQGVLSMTTGNWIFKPGTMDIRAFRSKPGNWYWVNYGTYQFPQWRVIDSTSNLITNQVFDEPVTFNKGQHWIVFKTKGLYGTIDTNFTVITEPTYSCAGTLMGGETILYVKDAFSSVDATTGNAFRLERNLINRLYPNGRMLFFNDSIQVLANDGSKLTKAMSIKRAIEELDLNTLLNGKTAGVESEVIDPVRRKINNHILIETARKNTFYLSINNNLIYPSLSYRESDISPILISENYYVEKLTGYCYKPPLPADSWKQKYGYNNYRIEKDSLILMNLSDLFHPNSGYEQVLDSLIEKEIQRGQFFGTTCVDVPGAVREFKRNFYFDTERLYFVHYPTGAQIRFSFKQLEGLLKDSLID